MVSTIDTMIPHLKTGKEFQYVLALDDSAGGDGIVARKEIKSIRDLRGRKVAVQEGSVSQFFLNVLLRDAGPLREGRPGRQHEARATRARRSWREGSTRP